MGCYKYKEQLPSVIRWINNLLKPFELEQAALIK